MTTPQQSSGPDVSQLKEKTLPDTPFPGGRQQPFRVYLAPDVHAGVWKHACENSSVEICGVLVGRWGRDATGPHAQATAYIRGEAASSKFAEVTFTHETWARINEQMDTRYADQSVIGWYHSHPDFGIFLSDRDRFIQEHFFSGPGQVAYVVDPIRKTEGIFVWSNGKPALAPYHWVGDRVQVSTAAGDGPPTPTEHPGKAGNDGSAVPSAGPSPGMVFWLDAFMRVASYGCVFLLGLVLAGYMTRTLNDFERSRIEQAARIQSLLYVNYRPGLGEELDEVGKDLLAVAMNIGAITKQHPELVEKSSESRDQLTEVAKGLRQAAERVTRARAVYALTPEENAQLLKLLSGGKASEEKKEKAATPKAASGPQQKESAPPASSK
jgi:proteasome lid subunit RPN8/RPN11